MLQSSKFDAFVADAFQLERVGDFNSARDKLRAALNNVGKDAASETQLWLAKLCLYGGSEVLQQEAEELLTSVQETALESGDARAQARSIHLLTLLARMRGDDELAANVLAQSPCAQNEAPLSEELGQYHHYKGMLAAERADLSAAESCYFAAFQTYREAGCEPGLAEVCDSLANLLLHRGKGQTALKFAERSLSAKQKLQDKYGEAIAWGTIGRIHMVLGRYSEAHDAFQRDLELARSPLNDVRGIGIMLNSLGDIEYQQQNYDDALSFYRQSVQENPQPNNTAFACLGIARTHLSTGRLDEALDATQEAKDLLEEENLQDRRLSACLEGMFGALAWRDGNSAKSHESGRKLLQQSIDALNQMQQPLDSIPFLYELRDLHQQRGEIALAVTAMSRALELMSQAGAERGVTDIEEWLRTVDKPQLTRLSLERQIPAPLVDEILDGKLTLPKPKKQRVAVLFSDLRGFTTLSENSPPEDVVDLLNEWFGESTRCVWRYGGIVDKFIGDAVMALFGVPEESPNAPTNALRAAIDMRDCLKGINLRQQALGGQTLKIGIGIAYGEAVVGFIGSPLRKSYTAVGDTVNVAARLEAKTKDYPGCEILISHEVAGAQQNQTAANTVYLGKVALKGRERKVAVYQVLD